jgi:hypothetical protein
MASPDTLKSNFIQASAVIARAYNDHELQHGTEATPAQLIEAINQFFVIYEKLGDKVGENSQISKENISHIGEQTIHCLIELGELAEQLNLPKERALMEETAFSAAHWVIRHKGEIRSLDVIVNILAAKANRTNDKTILTSLFHVMNDVLEHASPELKSDPDKSNPGRPWRMLNFNFAIVATRTMNRELMIKAFDTLGQNLPEDCPQFFEEGLIQSEKTEYGPEIKAIMTEYFKKWATLH